MANERFHVSIDQENIPLKIIVERRNGTRASLGKNEVILRIPKPYLGKPDIPTHVAWVTKWLKAIKSEKPNILVRYTGHKSYTDQGIYEIGDKKFILNILGKEVNKGTIKFVKSAVDHDGTLIITIPNEEGFDKRKLIKKLIIKFAQKYFAADIQRRVDHFNDLYFQKDINNIVLKYNKTNWGSCSSGKNLNFSVRLFFAPSDVIDYVIVHELAHLMEMNHSPRFWKIVADIMPDYKTKEKNLKVNSEHYDF